MDVPKLAARPVSGDDTKALVYSATSEAHVYVAMPEGGGEGGPIAAEDITDASEVGQAVLTAEDAEAARAAIGAAAEGEGGSAEISTDSGNQVVLGTDDGIFVAAPDLSGYATTTALTEGLGAKADTSSLHEVATSGSWDDLDDKPSIPSNPGDVGAAAASHGHTASQITDSGSTGRSLVQAANAAAARTTLSLGDAATRNVGTASDQVKPGDWTPAAGEIPDLPASKTTSGVFADARIPNLAASKITGGTFDVARLPVGTTAGTVKAGDWVPGASDIDATGTRDETTVLHGDGAWRAPDGMSADEQMKLAGLPEVVFVPEDEEVDTGTLSVPTLIVRYDPPVIVEPVVTVVGEGTSTATSTTVTATTTEDIQVGDVIAVAVSRGRTAGNTCGTQAVTLSAGAVGSWTRASSTRASSHDLAVLVAQVSTLIPSGTTVTVTTTGNSTNRSAVIVASVTDIASGTPDATSGDDSVGVTNADHAGDHGNAETHVTSTSAATTVTDTLVLAAFSIGADPARTPVGDAVIASIEQTTVGTSDRGVALVYERMSTTGVASTSITAPATGGWAAACVAMTIDLGG